MRLWFRFGLALVIVVPLSRQVGSNDSQLENLDLPYNAGLAGEETGDEDWVESVRFYGLSFEANAVVFCLDESKSMHRENRWETQKREITKSIMDLTPRAMFGVVVWGHGVNAFRKTLQPATPQNKRAAVASS